MDYISHFSTTQVFLEVCEREVATKRHRRKAGRPKWVVSTNLQFEEVAIHVDRGLSGNCPAHCRPSLASVSRSAQAELHAQVVWQVLK